MTVFLAFLALLLAVLMVAGLCVWASRTANFYRAHPWLVPRTFEWPMYLAACALVLCLGLLALL